MAILKKSSATTAVPSLEEASSEFRRLVTLQADLRQRKSALERENAEIATKLAEGARTNPARVAALLGDAPAEVADDDGLDISPERQAAIRQEHRDIVAALGELEGRIERERAKASREICERLAPEYARRVAAVCTALVDAHAAWSELHELTSKLNDRNVTWVGHLAPMAPGRILGSTPRDGQAPLARYLRDAAAAGFFPANSIPEGLRHG